MSEKTGAQSLVATLAQNGVTHCFANPGTSEMHLVQALDTEPRIKSVLCLFEGVVTGAADGFARIAQRPAMTLLHLGAGYGNGIANLHNAMKANVPMINVIGDHATYHRKYDAPLTCDLETLLKPHSKYIGIVESAEISGEIASKAFEEAMNEPNFPVSIILPADSAWNLGGIDGPKAINKEPSLIENTAIENVALAIQNAKKPAILVGGKALFNENALNNLARLKSAGIRIFCDTFPTRLRRGAGIFSPDRMQYFGEMAQADMAGIDLMVIAGTKAPIAFFAYPNKPSELLPDGCEPLQLSEKYEDTIEALAQLVAALDAPPAAPAPEKIEMAMPTGALNPFNCAQSIARHLPEHAIISDDAVTAGMPCYISTANAAPHDWLFLTGGAIGQGLPLAIGAQMAAPERRVLALTGDGAGMYTLQALWTMAREKLPIVSVVFANRNYRILNIEMARTGAGNVGETAKQMLSLDAPALDWVKLAEGHGIKAVSVNTSEGFDEALKTAFEANEPILIEAVV